jgi:diguanylate cyclase (GGDEF)-like protein
MTDNESATLQLLQRIGELTSVSTELVPFLDGVARLAAEIVGADVSSVLLMDADDTGLVVSACHGVDEESLRRVSFEPGEGIAGRVLESGRTERYADVVGDPQFVAFPWQEGGVHSLLAVPIRTVERVVGVLSVHAEAVDAFDAEHQAWLELLARQVASDVENAWLRETTCLDPLTRILNRAGCVDRMEVEFRRCRRHAWPMAIQAIDIDQFAAVNELHGRFVGDMVLREFARRVADEVRGEDVLARWSGELFLLLLPQTPAGAAEKIAERIRLRIQQRAFRSRRGAIPLTISIGVATTTENMARPTELVDLALKALGTAKKAGGSRIAIAGGRREDRG